MRIGIASDDQVSIASHFGRTKGFIIAEVEEGKIVSKEYRLNGFSHHAQGDHQHAEPHEKKEHGHSHTAIIQALSDCQTVIARGMGHRIYEDLRAANILATITNEETVESAIEAYLAGSLEDHPERGCQH